MKASWIKITISSFVICIFGWVAAGVCAGQADKDSQQYEKLERELRKDLDKEIAKFKPFKAVPIQAPNLNVISSYDKFKDETTVSIAMPLYHRVAPPLTGPVGDLKYIADIDIYAVYSYSGQQPVKPQSIYLIFESTADATAFGANPSLIFLADDKRMKMGNMMQKVRSYGTLIKETETAEIPFDSFMTLANADIVEVQVGQTAFPLSEFHMRGFRMLAGLPAKPVKQIQKADTGGRNLTQLDGVVGPIENTSWRGNHQLSIEFQPGGTFSLEGGGLGNRSGSWRQESDRVQVYLPSIGVGWGSRAVAVGIIKGDKMVLRLKLQEGIYGGTMNVVVQRDQ